MFRTEITRLLQYFRNLSKQLYKYSCNIARFLRNIFEIFPQYYGGTWDTTRREFLREILYKNIAIIAIQHSKMYFVDTFGDFSHTVEWNSLKSVKDWIFYCSPTSKKKFIWCEFLSRERGLRIIESDTIKLLKLLKWGTKQKISQTL